MSVVPSSTLVQMFNNGVATTPDSVATRTKTGGVWAPLTYREFAARARELGNGNAQP
jgi:long-subunit acyl-CoA synthetase (AMP-forming)